MLRKLHEFELLQEQERNFAIDCVLLLSVENSVRGDIPEIARKPRRSYLEAATDGQTMTTTETTSNDDHKVTSR
jgi:hypothetical protein